MVSKKFLKLLSFSGVLFSSVLLLSCNDGVKNVNNNSRKSIGTGVEITSFAADVSVYECEGFELQDLVCQSEYKILVKNSEDAELVRLDFSETEYDEAFSVITDGNETLVIDDENEKVISRTAVESNLDKTTEKKLKRLIGGYNFGKTKISTVRSAASDFKTTETEDGLLVVEIPNEYFSTETETRLVTKAYYTLDTELLVRTETVTETEEGVLTINSYPDYEKQENGEYIKIGIKSYIEFQSKEDETQSYKSTFVEIFENIQLNCDDDSKFRMILGE